MAGELQEPGGSGVMEAKGATALEGGGDQQHQAHRERQ